MNERFLEMKANKYGQVAAMKTFIAMSGILSGDWIDPLRDNEKKIYIFYALMLHFFLHLQSLHPSRCQHTIEWNRP